jgi:hypothetical protein
MNVIHVCEKWMLKNKPFLDKQRIYIKFNLLCEMPSSTTKSLQTLEEAHDSVNVPNELITRNNLLPRHFWSVFQVPCVAALFSPLFLCLTHAHFCCVSSRACFVFRSDCFVFCITATGGSDVEMASMAVTCASLSQMILSTAMAADRRRNSSCCGASRAEAAGTKMSVRGLKTFGGLKPEGKLNVMGFGMSQCTEQAFVAIMRAQCFAGRVGGARAKGGAIATKCDVASEIFTVVPIMSGLVLVGVALGFVLLRVEAAIEESE